MANSRRNSDVSSVKMLKPHDNNLFTCPVDSPQSSSSKLSECSSAPSSELNIAKHFVTEVDFNGTISVSDMSQSLCNLKQEVDIKCDKDNLSMGCSLTPVSEDTQSINACFNSGSSSDSQSCGEEHTKKKSEGHKRKSTDTINIFSNPKKLCIDTKKIKTTSSNPNPLLSKSLNEVTVMKEKPKDLQRCQWLECNEEVPFSELLDHLLAVHIKSQQPKKRSFKEQLKFSCRWVGCKVFNKPSTLLSWLEKHVICHLGNKPYRCIVDKCGTRFASQYMLNRHINRHFNSSLAQVKKGDWNGRGGKGGGSAGKNSKITKRKARKMTKMDSTIATSVARDIFDSPTMNCIQKHMQNLSSSTNLSTNSSSLLSTLHSKVIGQRTDYNNQVSYLLQWFPINSLPDEWVEERHLASKRSTTLPLTSLSPFLIQRLMARTPS